MSKGKCDIFQILILLYWNSRFVNELIFMSWFSKNINYIVILKFPKRVLEYYYSKVFGILEFNFNNLAKVPNEVKQIIHGEETHH